MFVVFHHNQQGIVSTMQQILSYFLSLLALAHLARVKHVQFKDGPVYGLTNLSIGKPSNEIKLHPTLSQL